MEWEKVNCLSKTMLEEFMNEKDNLQRLSFLLGKGVHMNKVGFVVLLILLSGCITSSTDTIQTVTDQYQTIHYTDGIDLNEAKIIAQRELIKQNMVKIYDLANPVEYTNVSDLRNSDTYWFVCFKEKKVQNIEFIFMAIIHKATGEIKFSDDFKEDKRWILEAVMMGT